ncbi:MAG: efflux RND transporter permease subunit [Reichenbachiella sp.]|uniref:efflux RND transporter permease subunit n=1 Tax=Reichenbachiella sp. TaxID=2184521 RepID=UPI00326737A2
MTQALKEMQANSQKKIIAFAGWVIKWRWLVLIATLGIAMGFGSGGRFLGFNGDYHVFFSEDNPQLLAYEALQNKYTKDDNVFIVVAAKDGKIFTQENLTAIEKLTADAWQTPYSTRVDAITNFQHTKAVADDLYVDDLVRNANERSDAELKEAFEIAINQPLLKDRLVDSKGSLTAVNITVKIPGERVEEGPEILASTRELVANFEAENPGLKTYSSGMVNLSGAFFEASMNDMGTLIPLMFLIIVITIVLTTRTGSGTLATLFVIIMSIMTAMGFAGWIGIQLTPPSAAAMTMIMTLAVADSIHLLITMVQSMKKGFSKKEAIVESVRVNFMPVFITSLTTVIGFLSMNFSDSPPFHDLGNMTAVGMTAAFLFSITTLPALMAILPVKFKQTSEGNEAQNPFFRKLADFVVSNDKKVLWGTVAASLFISTLMIKNELNEEFIKYFDSDITFRTDTDFISENLTGIYTVEFSIGSGEEGGINNPAYLDKLEEFDDWLNTQDEVVHVNSFSEIAKRINKSMHGDSLEYYRVPDNREQAAQFLLLYEMSLPFGLDLNNQVNVDKSETRFIITTKNVSSNQLIDFTERSQDWLKSNTPEAMHAVASSTSLMFSHLTRRQLNSMMTGSIGALILISFILMFALRSFRHGLLSLIPNLVPIAVGFGLWGITAGIINTGISVVFGMTLGIIVDDTVHFLSKYLRAKREHGMSSENAVRYAFDTVGKALVVTTVVLIAGFLVMAQSSFGMNEGMAKVTMLIISVALILDFLMLPAILLNVGDKSATKESENQITENGESLVTA